MYDDLERTSSPAVRPDSPSDEQRRQRDRLARRLDVASERSRRPSLTIRLCIGLASAVPGLLAVFVGVVGALIWRTSYGSAHGSSIGWTAAVRQVDWFPVLVAVALLCGVCAVSFRAGRLLYVPALAGLLIGASGGVLDLPWGGRLPVAIYDAVGRVEGFWGEWLAYAAVAHLVLAVALLRPIRRPLRAFRS